MDVKLPWSVYRELWTPYPAAPKGEYLKDKVVVITGATSGIGLEATKQLAEASPSQLILAVRSTENGETLLAQIKKKYPKIRGKVTYLDLTEIKSIKKFAEEMNGFGRVDWLINNAAINPNFSEGPYRSTEDGYERVFQTNVLGPALTTFLLLPLLKASKEPQVLFVGSDGHGFAKHDLIQSSIDNHESILGNYNSAEKYDNSRRYLESKLLLQMYTRELINYLPWVSIINVNPGPAMTNIGREFNFGLSFQTIYLLGWAMINMRGAKSAARNLTSASAWKGGSQDYWSSCVPLPSENIYLYSGKGIKATKVFFKEMLEELEKIVPGCTSTNPVE